MFTCFKNNSPKKEDKKFYPAPLDAPRQEFSIRIFKTVAALSVSGQIHFVCVCTGRPIQLYTSVHLVCDYRCLKIKQ